jgi:hypothetical protein
MKRLLAVLAAAFATVALTAAPGFAGTNDQVCPPGDSGQIDAGGTDASITITAPAGFLISGYCVKAGSVQQGNGPEFVTVDPPQASVTITHSSGKGISHYSYTLVAAPTTTTTGGPTTTTTTTTGGPTTTTGGPTTTTGGPTTTTEGPTTTTEGPTTSTAGGPTSTTGSGGVLGGTTGGTGGTTGGTAATGGNLPFTGLPIWLPLLAAASLLASGIMLIRRRKGEIS